MTTAAELVAEGAAILAAAGIETPRAEARLLLETVGIARAAQVSAPDQAITAPQALSFRELVGRRAAREPMAYLRGRAEFWSLDFLVGPGVLVPRADTETLIEAATHAFPDRAAPLRLLDIGTGSGCLAVTLLHLYPAATGTGTDTSPAALALARCNAERLRVAGRLELRATRWAEGVPGGFDLVVANPPYIPTDEIDELQPEVARFEPRLALDGGPDGLAAYRAILADLPRLLAPAGIALLEIGRGQEEALLPLTVEAGFVAKADRDLAGVIRCLELRRRPAA